MLHGVDMTPQSYDWQAVASVDLAAFCNKPLSELHAEIDTLTKEYGDDAIMRLHSYEQGGGWSMRTDTVIPSTTHHYLKVYQNLPVWTQEQRHAQMKQSCIDYEERTRTTPEEYAALVEKLKLHIAKQDDQQSKRIQELHQIATGKKKR